MGTNSAIQWTDHHRARFFKHCEQGQESECWEWKGARLRNGYGAFAKPEGGTITAHRASYLLAHGHIDANLVIDHKCRNRGCVNPAHLEAVTNQENTIRGLRGHLPESCSNGHQWTAENTGTARNGRRFCRECVRARDRERRNAEYWRQYRAKKREGRNA